VSSGRSGRRPSRGSWVVAALVAAIAMGWPSASHATPAAGPRLVPAAGYVAWSQVAARARPDAHAPVVRVVTQFDDEYRPTVVLAIGVRLGTDGRPAWYRISLPGRPNGLTAWVRAPSLELRPVRRAIEIDRSDRVLTLRQDGRVLLRTRVAVGATGMETPVGLFYVVRKFRPTAPVLGAFAMETSAYSKLSEWPGGGVVGIHGTNQPSLLGGAVSHGCVRVENAAIVRLARLTPVGTPIRIVP
jgi:lipoprotein-anchoring transpeptidase ErfK/SrfK